MGVTNSNWITVEADNEWYLSPDALPMRRAGTVWIREVDPVQSAINQAVMELR